MYKLCAHVQYTSVRSRIIKVGLLNFLRIFKLTILHRYNIAGKHVQAVINDVIYKPAGGCSRP